MNMKLILRIMIAIIFLSTAAFAQEGKIKLKITGMEEVIGHISIGLFNSPEHFPKKSEGSLGAHIEVKDSMVEYVFTNLEPGDYAIAIYHDENSNGELDRNWIGFPNEDYVFSNYATGSFGPPSFEDAKFSLIDSLTLSLQLNK